MVHTISISMTNHPFLFVFRAPSPCASLCSSTALSRRARRVNPLYICVYLYIGYSHNALPFSFYIQGAVALCIALQRNRTLKTLALEQNRISLEGGDAMLRELRLSIGPPVSQGPAPLAGPPKLRDPRLAIGPHSTQGPAPAAPTGAPRRNTGGGSVTLDSLLGEGVTERGGGSAGRVVRTGGGSTGGIGGPGMGGGADGVLGGTGGATRVNPALVRSTVPTGAAGVLVGAAGVFVDVCGGLEGLSVGRNSISFGAAREMRALCEANRARGVVPPTLERVSYKYE